MRAIATIVALLMLPLGETSAGAEELTGYRNFVYVSDQRIVTLEVVDTNAAILNYISLGPTFELLQVPRIVLADNAGGGRRAHVLVDETSNDPLEVYQATVLIKPGDVVGYELRGRFGGETALERALIDIGGRVLELAGLNEEDFEIAIARAGELNLEIADRARALQMAGFEGGIGVLHEAGTERAEELKRLFPSAAQLAPVMLQNPPPRLPSRYAGLPQPVTVKLQVHVSRTGNIGRVEVVEGVNAELDEMASETVRNSWSFLPAIADNATADSQAVVNVVFAR